jgi:outer membrane protein TolC
MNYLRLRSFLFCVFLAAGGSAAIADDVEVPERLFPELGRILQSALQQSPRILARNLDLVIAEGEETQAKSGQYPSIGGSVGYRRSDEKRQGIQGSFTTDILDYSLTLNQPVWHWQRVRNNARIGEIRRQIAQQQYTDAYRLLAQEIRAGYLNLIIRKLVTENARYTLKLVEDRLANAEERLAKGVASAGELFRPRMDALQTRLNTDRAVEDLEQSLRGFRRLTGMEALREEDLPATIPSLNGDENTAARLLAGFLSQKDPQTNGTLVMTRQLEIENLNLAITRKRLYPMFNFTAGITQNRQSYSLDVSQLYRVEDRYVGIGASWAIFDGMATRGAIRAATARKQQLEASYRQATENLAKDAQHAGKDVEFALRQMRIDDRLFDERRTFLEGLEAGVKTGTATEAGVNDARVSFNSYQINAYSSRAAYLQRLGDLLGLIMEDPVLQTLKTGAHE